MRPDEVLRSVGALLRGVEQPDKGERLWCLSLCSMGRIGETDEKVKRKYRLDASKVYTPPIIERQRVQQEIVHFPEQPLNPPGQEHAPQKITIECCQDVFVGRSPVNPARQACRELLQDSSVRHASGVLYPCGDVWEAYDFFDEHGRPWRFQYGYSLKPPDVDEYIEYVKIQVMMSDIESMMDEIENAFPSEERECVPLTEEERQKERQRYLRKVKQTVQRLINANRLTYMYTLTFALEENENVKGLRCILPEEKQRDRHEVFKIWNSRLTWMRKELKARYQRDFKFVLVLEVHDSEETDSRKVGTYHLHLATDKPLDKHELQELWGYGTVFIDDFKRGKRRNPKTGKIETYERDFLNDPGAYMAKYLEKEIDATDEDFETWKQHRYSSSRRNLKRPENQKIRDDEKREEALKDPKTVFDFEGASKVIAAKVRALKDINQVKTFENTYEVEFKKWDSEKKDYVPVKMFVRKRVFNFRMLLPDAKKYQKGFIEKK